MTSNPNRKIESLCFKRCIRQILTFRNHLNQIQDLQGLSSELSAFPGSANLFSIQLIPPEFNSSGFQTRVESCVRGLSLQLSSSKPLKAASSCAEPHGCLYRSADSCLENESRPQGQLYPPWTLVFVSSWLCY